MPDPDQPLINDNLIQFTREEFQQFQAGLLREATNLMTQAVNNAVAVTLTHVAEAVEQASVAGGSSVEQRAVTSALQSVAREVRRMAQAANAPVPTGG